MKKKQNKKKQRELNNKKLRAYRVVIWVAVVVVLIDVYILLQSSSESKKRQEFIKTQEIALGTNNVPSSAKPSTKAVAAYTVPPNLPKYLVIPAINVDAEVSELYATTSGQIEAPDNIFTVGWYDNSSLPGQQGAMFIDGHVSSWTADGVFYNLKKLVPGDTIKVIRGDNTTFTYVVKQLQVYAANDVNMTQALAPSVPGTVALNLMTCTGSVIAGTSEFNQRIVVYSELQT